jgi:DNA excision repair protein ERCC-2
MKVEKTDKNTEETTKVRISVRTLVEFLMRSGDLVKGKSALADRNAMQAGSRAHRRLQGRRGASYRAEVPLSREFPYPGDEKCRPEVPMPCPPFTLVIEGRADGVDEKNDTVTIEEIKGIYRNPDELENPEPVHLAQAKCYAAIYGEQNHLDTIRIRMTYVSLEDYKTHAFHSTWDVSELCKWFFDLAAEAIQWARLQVRWERIRNASANGMEFPFPYRKGQKEMTAAVYQTIRRDGQLFVQAPTGIGKTMSALFPAVHALTHGTGEKIFYLTAKTVARTVAEEAFSILRQKGLSIRSLTVTAKEKICAGSEVNCSPDVCPRAKGHFDRVNDALMDLLRSSDDFTRERILAQSEKFCVCPYELQLDLSEFADCVICDYNYVFDPDAKIGRYFGDTAGKGKVVLLIDEAHNLIDRGRDMYSAALSKENVLGIRKILSGRDDPKIKKITAALTAVNKELRKLKKECENRDGTGLLAGSRWELLDSIGKLAVPLMNLAGLTEEFLTGKAAAEAPEELTDFYFSLQSFLNRYDEYGDCDRIVAVCPPGGGFAVRIMCMNPASRLQRILDKCKSTIFFSATLFPIRYYERLLTTKEDSYSIYIPSPFDPSNRLVAVASDVSSRYSRRGPDEYGKIAAYIDDAVSSRSGNYLIFFPSYRMMEEVLSVYLKRKNLPPGSGDEGGYMTAESAGLRVFAQCPGMTEQMREQFLAEFSENRGTLAAFSVMGGIFAEGIDLTGKKLIGAVIVGNGLPKVSWEREILRRFADENGRNGFDLAYLYPGMNKVLQAAGRVIRTAEDIGVILLLDERFLKRESLALMPREWNDLVVVNQNTVRRHLEDFWKRQASESERGTEKNSDRKT